MRGFGGKLLGGKGSAALAAPPAEGQDTPPEAPAEKGMPEVDLPGVTEAALKLLLGFMYTSRLAVTDENWQEILPAADKLEVEGAKKAVEQHFSQPGKLIASNAASVLALAEKHHAAGVKSLCVACIEADWAGCTSAESFSELPKETIQALLVRARCPSIFRVPSLLPPNSQNCLGRRVENRFDRLAHPGCVRGAAGNTVGPCRWHNLTPRGTCQCRYLHAYAVRLHVQSPPVREHFLASWDVGLNTWPTRLQASDTIRAPELAIFHATIAWGKAQLKAAPPPAEEAPAEGEDAAAPKQNGLDSVLDGVIDLVRFPLISPEDLRDAVQPALKEEKYAAAERLVLEGYQYHALVKIGQPHNLEPAKTRPRRSPPPASQANPKQAAAAAGNASPPSGPDQAAVGDAILRAHRTSRWLASLPQGVERVSMAGMRLGEDDAIVLADFLQKR